MSDPNALGYIVCHTCKEPKAIKQGSGKRSRFVHGRCSCGPDMRTGAAAQAEMKAYLPLEEVQAQLLAINTESEPKDEPNLTPSETKPVIEPETKSKPIEGQFIPKDEPEPKPMGATVCVGAGAVAGLILGYVFKSVRAAL
ncbi:hypothetical protein [Photobacterium halotolerans]|uniref:BCTnown n=1 Tax=Photobacterium halotolerans TaxID=265726 RepID=A0A7X5AV86_9GAMM|nr:hypothetical protein [Photobacterium halotolerans]NAW67652.1 hypothetical protein [Photobacterium halotolerans]